MATGVLKISDAATLAIHAMVVLAANQGAHVPVNDIADTIGLSATHLGKVFQRLARVGLVTSRRGPGGGFLLSKRPEEIRLLDIYQGIDGPLIENSCLLSKGACALDFCIFGDLNRRVQHTVKEYLGNTTLADVHRPIEF